MGSDVSKSGTVVELWARMRDRGASAGKPAVSSRERLRRSLPDHGGVWQQGDERML